jgi:hypothetical protein
VEGRVVVKVAVELKGRVEVDVHAVPAFRTPSAAMNRHLFAQPADGELDIALVASATRLRPARFAA